MNIQAQARRLLGLLDLTLLDPSADTAAMHRLCDRAVTPFGRVAAVCIPPADVSLCRERLAGTGVRVVLVKPGPTDTPMTAHLKGQGAKLAPVESVAKHIVDGIAAGKPVVYAPGKWWLIMMVIRHLPSFIFNKMNI